MGGGASWGVRELGTFFVWIQAVVMWVGTYVKILAQPDLMYFPGHITLSITSFSPKL